jgi:hypothetical protein
MDGGSEKEGCGGVWWTPMEEEPPWEPGSLLYWVKKVEKMKKMEEEVFGAEERERRSWDSEKLKKRGVYIVERGLRAEIG